MKSKPRPSAPGQWCLYVLRCADGTLYCGITNDLPRRTAQHNRGTGARYTRGRGPVKLARAWPHPDRSAASKAEHAFKKLSRREKEQHLASAKLPRASPPHSHRKRPPKSSTTKRPA